MNDVPTDEDVDPQCPSCLEKSTLRPSLASVDDQSSARVDHPLDMDLPVNGVFLAVECGACGWGEHSDAQVFAAPDPSAEGAAILFAMEDPEAFAKERVLDDQEVPADA